MTYAIVLCNPIMIFHFLLSFFFSFSTQKVDAHRVARHVEPIECAVNCCIRKHFRDKSKALHAKIRGNKSTILIADAESVVNAYVINNAVPLRSATENSLSTA